MEQSTLYELNLDFTKELNYTKAIMARQGDKGVQVAVNTYLHGLPFVGEDGGTFTLKATTPSGKYVDAPTTSVDNNHIVFTLDNRFLSEKGFYSHCYVEYRTANIAYTTQDITFFNANDSDISQGQGDEYISQLEQLIEMFNTTFDDFMEAIQVKADGLETQLTNLDNKQKALQAQLDELKADIESLNFQKYKLTNDDGTAFTLSSFDTKPTSFIEVSKKLGYVTVAITDAQTFTDYSDVPAEMKTGNVYGFIVNNISNVTTGATQILYNVATTGQITRMATRRVIDNTSATPFTILPIQADLTTIKNQAIAEAKTYTDTKATEVKSYTDTQISATKKGTAFMAVYGEAPTLADQPSGTKLPFGNLLGLDPYHTESDLPYTMSSDRITLTFTRDCVILFEGLIKGHINNTVRYIYVKIRKNGGDYNFCNVGSSVNLNFVTSMSGQYVHTFKTGDTLYFNIESEGNLFRTNQLSMKLTELKGV